MAAKINTLRGQLKLDPKLSTIAGQGKKDNVRAKTSKKKNKKNTFNCMEQKKMSTGIRYRPKQAKQRKESKLGNLLGL
jgi:hypothetical protein